MYILSQDKKSLCDFCKLQITRNYGGKKNEKYVLIAASTRPATDFITLGHFASEERAMAELQSIFSALQNRESTYAVKPDITPAGL